MNRRIKSFISVLAAFVLALSMPVTAMASCPISSSTDSSASSEAEQYYNMLPKALRNQFESDGWEIMISDVTAVNMMSAINEDPEGYADRKTSEWKDYLEGIDWEQKGKDAANSFNKKVKDYNDKIDDSDPEKASKEFAADMQRLFSTLCSRWRFRPISAWDGAAKCMPGISSGLKEITTMWIVPGMIRILHRMISST